MFLNIILLTCSLQIHSLFSSLSHLHCPVPEFLRPVRIIRVDDIREYYPHLTPLFADDILGWGGKNADIRWDGFTNFGPCWV